MSESRVRLHIAVGVVLDQAADKVLVARRPEHLHLGGLLEFPGGKLDPGEHVRDALARELREELNINVTRARPLIRINHDYTKESVLLDVWLVTDWSGEAEGMEDQEIMWLQKDALSKTEFPDADRSIITAVNLPAIYGITPDLAEYDGRFFARLEDILKNGLKLLQFRSKQLEEQSKLRVLRNIFDMCRDHNCRLLINGIAGEAMLDFTDGLHLTGRDLMSLEQRPLAEDCLIAASCHNPAEVEQACRIGADFAVLSPVNTTASHADIEPIGWDGFTDIVQECNIPVYALGGLKTTDMDKAISCGGQGIAMISGLFN